MDPGQNPRNLSGLLLLARARKTTVPLSHWQEGSPRPALIISAPEVGPCWTTGLQNPRVTHLCCCSVAQFLVIYDGHDGETV